MAPRPLHSQCGAKHNRLYFPLLFQHVMQSRGASASERARSRGASASPAAAAAGAKEGPRGEAEGLPCPGRRPPEGRRWQPQPVPVRPPALVPPAPPLIAGAPHVHHTPALVDNKHFSRPSGNMRLKAQAMRLCNCAMGAANRTGSDAPTEAPC